MNVYIIQHEDAVSSDISEESHLSKTGARQVNKAVDFLKRCPEYPEVILHSRKKSAFETAEMISFGLGGIHMEQMDYISPKEEPDNLVNEINKADKSVLIVGNMPFLEKLVSRLVESRKGKSFIEMKNASPLILKKYDEGFLIETYIKNESIR